MRYNFPIAKLVKTLVGIIVGLLLLIFAYLLAFNAGCVPKVASPETNTSQRSSTSAGDNSTVTSITLALTEYGPTGLIGVLSLWLGRLYGWRQQRVTSKALERVMAEIEKNRWLGVPVDNVVTGLRRFDDSVERKIRATANKFGPSPAEPLNAIPRVEGSTNQETEP